MKSLVPIVLSPFVLLLQLGIAASAPIEVIDDRGKKHRFVQAPTRIVSLAPSQTEIIAHLDQLPRLVGRTVHCDFPPDVSKVPSLGQAFPPSYERIMALRPDVVLMMSGTVAVRQRLETLGVPVVVSQPRTVSDVAKVMVRLAKMMGVTEIGQAKAQAFRAALAHSPDVPEQGRPLVFYEVWPRPLTTAGPRTFAADLIRLAWGTNLVQTGRDEWPRISPETVVMKDPAVVLVGSDARRSAWLAERGPWTTTRAARAGRVYTLANADEFSRPGPRILGALKWLRAKLAQPSAAR
ncbi:MAG: helical backbone metal receptor [Myxococcota bacterium]|nr:helical backbone metal receptor [Myxococcota bacterium]